MGQEMQNFDYNRALYDQERREMTHIIQKRTLMRLRCLPKQVKDGDSTYVIISHRPHAIQTFLFYITDCKHTAEQENERRTGNKKRFRAT